MLRWLWDILCLQGPLQRPEPVRYLPLLLVRRLQVRLDLSIALILVILLLDRLLLLCQIPCPVLQVRLCALDAQAVDQGIQRVGVDLQQRGRLLQLAALDALQKRDKPVLVQPQSLGQHVQGQTTPLGKRLLGGKVEVAQLLPELSGSLVAHQEGKPLEVQAALLPDIVQCLADLGTSSAPDLVGLQRLQPAVYRFRCVLGDL